MARPTKSRLSHSSRLQVNGRTGRGRGGPARSGSSRDSARSRDASARGLPARPGAPRGPVVRSIPLRSGGAGTGPARALGRSGRGPANHEDVARNSAAGRSISAASADGGGRFARSFDSAQVGEAAFRHLSDAMLAWEELVRRKRGFLVRHMKADGNCLFRAVADQVYGDAELHEEVRKRCMDYMEKERDYFSHYVTGEFSQYVARRRRLGSYGTHVEIQAMAELYNRPIQIYEVGGRLDPINTFQIEYRTDNPPIRLAYWDRSHYNSILDPGLPAAGVGLGMPGLIPGSAGDSLVGEALRVSEAEQLDKVVLDELGRYTDREQTQRDLVETVLMLSRLEYAAETQRRPQLGGGHSSSSPLHVARASHTSTTSGNVESPRRATGSPPGSPPVSRSSSRLR